MDNKQNRTPTSRFTSRPSTVKSHQKHRHSYRWRLSSSNTHSITYKRHACSPSRPSRRMQEWWIVHGVVGHTTLGGRKIARLLSGFAVLLDLIDSRFGVLTGRAVHTCISPRFWRRLSIGWTQGRCRTSRIPRIVLPLLIRRRGKSLVSAKGGYC